MDVIGLYYPYFHVRDDTWLKAAALYLPELARVRPARYPVGDSPTATVLRDELGFLRDVDPRGQALLVAQEFAAFVLREREALLEAYRIDPMEGVQRGFGWEIEDPILTDDTRYAWIHRSQIGDGPDSLVEFPDRAVWPFLGEMLCDLGLARFTRFDPLTGVRDDGQWLGMHPHLVAAYSCALADRIAAANALTPVTDDPALSAFPRGWTVDELAATLLSTTPAPSRSSSGTVAAHYATAAIRAVVPADLDHVPVDKIVQARRKLTDEFHAFRDHMDALADDFDALAGIEDPAILESRMAAMVERDMAEPARDLERGLRSLGMQPARAVLGLRTLELPAIAALGAHAVGLPPIASASGMMAVQVVGSAHQARRAARARRRSAPGYLLGLRQELTPTGVLARARRALRTTSGRD